MLQQCIYVTDRRLSRRPQNLTYDQTEEGKVKKLVENFKST